LSITVTVKLHDAEFPDESVTVNVIVVTPALKVYVPMFPVPDATVAPVIDQDLVTELQLSLAEGSGTLTILLHRPAFAFALMFDGHVTEGGMESIFDKVNVQLEVFPAASVAVSVMVVLPTADITVPAAGDCVIIMDPEPVQLSETIARPVKSGTTAEHEELS
jgi:hypothetical protein